MRKHDQGSAAAEGVRRATGAAAERDHRCLVRSANSGPWRHWAACPVARAVRQRVPCPGRCA